MDLLEFQEKDTEEKRLPGLNPPPAPPELIERLKNEAVDVIQVSGTEIFYYYAQSQFIGRGASSWVFRGYHTAPKRKAAVKRIDLSGEGIKESYLNEIEILEGLHSKDTSPDSKYIISFYHYAIQTSAIFVAMELAACSLEQEMEYNMIFPRDNAIMVGYLRNLSKGLDYLHRNLIVHRDIKPQNIFICQEKETSFRRIAKLGDFGLSRQLSSSQGSFSMGKGTKVWMAPEALKALDEEDEFLNTKAMDIFSFGLVISYSLNLRKYPFSYKGKHLANIKNEMAEPGYWETFLLKPAGNHLVFWMLQKGPSKRPTIQQCRAHPFLWENEGETHLEFFTDILSCLFPESPVSDANQLYWDLKRIRDGLDYTLATWFLIEHAKNDRPIKFSQWNWKDEVDDRILLSKSPEGDDPEYVGTSAMSYIRLIADKAKHPERMVDDVVQDLFVEEGVFNRAKFVKYFLGLYPKVTILLFLSLARASPMYSFLKPLEEKYLKEFVGHHENWNVTSWVNMSQKIILGELRLACRVSANVIGPVNRKRNTNVHQN